MMCRDADDDVSAHHSWRRLSVFRLFFDSRIQSIIRNKEPGFQIRTKWEWRIKKWWYVSMNCDFSLSIFYYNNLLRFLAHHGSSTHLLYNILLYYIRVLYVPNRNDASTLIRSDAIRKTILHSFRWWCFVPYFTFGYSEKGARTNETTLLVLWGGGGNHSSCGQRRRSVISYIPPLVYPWYNDVESTHSHKTSSKHDDAGIIDVVLPSRECKWFF